MNDNEIKNDAKLSKLALDIIQNKDIRITELWEERCRIYESLKEAKAEIDELQLKITSCNSEIERLQNAYKQCAWERDTFLDELKTAKSEAIKEFADRLKEKGRYPLTNIYYEVIGLKQRKIWLEEDIDNLVKEMTENDFKE